jgi:hypothetical protein
MDGEVGWRLIVNEAYATLLFYPHSLDILKVEVYLNTKRSLCYAFLSSAFAGHSQSGDLMARVAQRPCRRYDSRQRLD